MFAHDPAWEFEQLRGLTSRELRPAGRSERWLRRPSYEQVTLGVIPNATRFSSDPALWNVLGLIGEFMQHEYAAALAEFGGVFSRRCRNGNWPVVYLAYVMSGRRSMKRFHNELAPQVFALCGFGDWSPSYPEMHLRFVELETRWEAFVDTLALIVAPALKAVPSLGLIGMLDSSHASSPSAIHHACLDEDACKKAGGDPTKDLETSVAAVMAEARAKEAEKPGDDEASDRPERTRGEIEVYRYPSGRRVLYRVLYSQGHRWLTLDLTSGLRKYDAGVSWFGCLTPTFVAAPVGLPLVSYAIPADIPEWEAWPRIYALVCRVLGRPPFIVSVDRGFGFSPFFAFNAMRGVATVGPRRLRTGTKRDDRRTWRLKTGLVDEDGVPRCPVCGGETRQHGQAPSANGASTAALGWYLDENGNPRIRFVCAAPYVDECRIPRSISCAEDYAWLLPLSRLHPLYNDVRFGHHNHEGAFRYARDRFTVAGKDGSSQLLRPGVEPHRLRLWASHNLDWFRAGLRHGWIPAKTITVALNSDTIMPLSGVGAARLAERLERRRQLGTNLPYGRAWNRFSKKQGWS